MTTEGGDLRSQLTTALEANQKLADEVARLTAKDAVSGLEHVKPEDLTDVEPHEMAARAAEINEARATEQRGLISKVFEQRGLSGPELDTAVDEFLAGTEDPGSDDGGTLDRIRELGGGGATVTDVNVEDMTPTEKIEYGIRQKAQSKS